MRLYTLPALLLYIAGSAFNLQVVKLNARFSTAGKVQVLAGSGHVTGLICHLHQFRHQEEQYPAQALSRAVNQQLFHTPAMPSIPLRQTVATSEGGSRFVEGSLPLSESTPYGLFTEKQPISGFYVRTVRPSVNAKLNDYHCAPEDQYVLQLKGGGIQVGSTEGQSETKYPVSWGRVSDTTGRGHSSKALSDEPRVSLFVPVRVESSSA